MTLHPRCRWLNFIANFISCVKYNSVSLSRKLFRLPTWSLWSSLLTTNSSCPWEFLKVNHSLCVVWVHILEFNFLEIFSQWVIKAWISKIFNYSTMNRLQIQNITAWNPPNGSEGREVPLVWTFLCRMSRRKRQIRIIDSLPGGSVEVHETPAPKDTHDSWIGAMMPTRVGYNKSLNMRTIMKQKYHPQDLNKDGQGMRVRMAQGLTRLVTRTRTPEMRVNLNCLWSTQKENH